MKGFSLIELLIAVAILSIGILSLIGGTTYLSRTVQSSKNGSLASNLAQEKIENLKNMSYASLVVTTSPVSDTCFPSVYYDQGYFPKETVVVGDVNFTRAVYVRKVAENSSGDMVYKSWTDPDTGLKEITVYVTWEENGSCKKLELRNLRDDPNRLPLESTFYGAVSSGSLYGLPVSGANVYVLQNPSWSDETDASGAYSFRVAEGTYTVVVAKDGFFVHMSSSLVIGEGVSYQQNFALLPMSSGTISGTAYIRDHLVVSQVVGSYLNGSDDQEYLELYNPTTYTWTIASGAASPVIKVLYQTRNMSTPMTFEMDYYTYTIPSYHYYLFANTATVTAGGVTRAADAVFKTTNPGYPNLIKTNSDPGNAAACIGISWASNNQLIDYLGWSTSGNNPPEYEGSPLSQTTGLESSEQYVRRVAPSYLTSYIGRSYDSNNNNSDFQAISSITYPPRNSADFDPPATGTPASGAYASVNDGLSTTVTANSSGVFSVPRVATGTWTLELSSGAYSYSITGAVVYANATTSVGYISLVNSTSNGYVSGTVKDAYSQPIYQVGVTAQGLAVPVTTDAQGRYQFAIASGAYTVTANPANIKTAYTEETISDVVVSTGQITSGVDFILRSGGKLSGFATTNGTDPYPGIVFDAKLGGISQGVGVADSQGRFTISNLAAGVYELAAAGPNTEQITPSSAAVYAVAGATVFAGTFTVSGGFGTISGELKSGSSPIKTGVLVIASTGTISSAYPPTVDASFRSGSVKYYQETSRADGTYSLSVPAGTYNVYAWYTAFSGSTPSVTKKQGSATVSALGTTTLNLTW